jgi:ParB/RepB/Spo0J family partition protein
LTTATVQSPERSALGEFQTLAIGQLRESPMNVRRHYTPGAMAELVASIRAVGVLTPLLARPSLALGGFEIAAGHRRFRAATEAGVEELPVRVLNLDDQAFLEVVTIENLQRQDIHPLDEADGYQQLMIADPAYTVEAIAAKVGKSASYVYQRLKLTNLIPEAREAWEAEEITPAHAIRLARLPDTQQREGLKECWHPLYRDVARGDTEGPKREPAPLSNLERWIERHVKVETAAPETQYYFPEVAEQIAAEEEPEKLLQLSESHMPGADLGTKTHGILGQARWTRITGPKNRCANATKGVVVHGGPMRVLEVCATKGCPKHFPERKKTKTAGRGAAKRESWQVRHRREEEQRRREAAAWEGVAERIKERILTAIVTTGPKGRVLEEALSGVRNRVNRRAHGAFDTVVGKVTAENFLVATVAADTLEEIWRLDQAKAAAKTFGVELKDLEQEYKAAAAPPKVEKPAPAKKALARKKGSAAKSAKKARR